LVESVLEHAKIVITDEKVHFIMVNIILWGNILFNELLKFKKEKTLFVNAF